MLFESGKQRADIPVHARDHGRVGGFGSGMWQVGATKERLRVHAVRVFCNRFLRDLQGQVGNGRGKDQEERILGVGIDEVQGRVQHQVGCVVIAAETLVVFVLCCQRLVERLMRRIPLSVVQGIGLRITPQVGRVIIVGHTLAEIAVEAIESLIVRMTFGIWSSQAPFPNKSGRVSGRLEHLCDGDFRVLQRQLPFRLVRAPAAHLEVVPDVRVAGVFACQQGTTRWRTNRRP